MSSTPARLIVLEGAEGAGKSTQVGRLAARLRLRGVPALEVREPGGTPLGDEIRRLLLQPCGDVDERAEALLFMASRAQLVARVIRPALEAGTTVIADRFFLSTYAYQVAGRGLPDDDVRRANALATGGLVPDLTLLLAFPPEEGLARAGRRGAHDRMESSGLEFHRRVAEAFALYATEAWQRAHPECGRILEIDARGDADAVDSRIADAVNRMWPETFGL